MNEKIHKCFANLTLCMEHFEQALGNFEKCLEDLNVSMPVVLINRVNVLSKFNGVAREDHEKALTSALRDVNANEVEEAMMRYRSFCAVGKLVDESLLRGILNAFLLKRRVP